ncbi:hypothetical protein [Nitrosospira sp. Nsp11]|uniref:hypothetical protein n=1 Tax=Nitrosospira sp. Nsp11 TaxID=1855338 RepID=UPI0009335983|nr:hypothetical protein [Nitrosospira sp. Nsp11]
MREARISKEHPFHIDARVSLPDHLHCLWRFTACETHGLARWAAEWPYSTFHRFVAAGVYPPDWGIAESENDGGPFGE